MNFIAGSFLIASLLTVGAPLVFAGEQPVAADSQMTQGPKIFVDCASCDQEYLRAEIHFVNFVRDRQLADVHVLVSTQRTGSGGTEYTTEFIGLGSWQGRRDTLKFSVLESDSDDNVRREVLRAIKIGVLPYVAKTPLARHISIGYDQPAKTGKVIDPWDSWVFTISGNTYFSGEESNHYLNLWGELTARRITEGSKIELEVYGSYTEDLFKYTLDTEQITTLSLSRSKSAEIAYVLSITQHWSAGGYATASSSTYSNRDYRIEASPAIEYNVFPYRQSTRRQLRLAYYLTPSYVNYIEETIFNRTHEWLFSQNLSAELKLTQPWGSVTSQLSGSSYLHDFSKNSLNSWSKLSLRLVKGLSLNIEGNISRVRNQLSLPKGNATPEEILLRRRQMATDYQYWTSIGISYSFGSIYNNVVNPRFGD